MALLCPCRPLCRRHRLWHRPACAMPAWLHATMPDSIVWRDASFYKGLFASVIKPWIALQHAW